MGRCLQAGCSWSRAMPEAVWHGETLEKLAAISSRYLQWQPEGKQRIQKCEIFLLEGLAFVAKGVLWVRKNNAVLASGSLPSLPLSSPLTPTLVMTFISFSSWSYGSGKRLKISLCTERVCSLHSSHRSLLLLGSPQLCSTPPPKAAQSRAPSWG